METIALYEFKEKYKIWIGITFLFSLGLSSINIFEFFRELFNMKKLEKLELKLQNIKKEEYQDILESLDEDELINIREFYIQEKNTIQMISNDSAVAGLIHKRVIQFVSKEGWRNTYTEGNVFLFKLSDNAKDYFDNYDFTSLDSISRPNWLNGIVASNKMKQNIENMHNNLLNTF